MSWKNFPGWDSGVFFANERRAVFETQSCRRSPLLFLSSKFGRQLPAPFQTKSLLSQEWSAVWLKYPCHWWRHSKLLDSQASVFWGNRRPAVVEPVSCLYNFTWRSVLWTVWNFILLTSKKEKVGIIVYNRQSKKNVEWKVFLINENAEGLHILGKIRKSASIAI